MTTKGPSRKQVIIPMVKLNTKLIINSANLNIANINNCLRKAKSDIIANFIHLTNNGVIINMNKLAITSNPAIIKKYVKNINNINLDNINCPCLPKSKSYLKIIGLPYQIEQSMLTSKLVEGILKNLHLFENIILTSKL